MDGTGEAFALVDCEGFREEEAGLSEGGSVRLGFESRNGGRKEEEVGTDFSRAD